MNKYVHMYLVVILGKDVTFSFELDDMCVTHVLLIYLAT